MSFDPITLIAAGVSAVGSIMSGVAQSSAERSQARIAEMNREVSEQNAERAVQRSAIEAQDQDFQTLAMLGQQEAVQGASGLGGRSQFLARKTARELGRRDALNVRQAGEIEAYNYEVEAANQQANADALRRSAGFSLLSGFLGAGESLVGAAKGTRSPRKFNPQPVGLMT